MFLTSMTCSDCPTDGALLSSYIVAGRCPPGLMVAAFPVRTCEFSAEVGGMEMAFLMSAYADRILVIVTQLGTLGTVQSAK